jgi:uncharacterized damage-inducible protein DinB
MTTKDDVTATIRRNSGRFLDVFAEMSEAQWSYRPSDVAWSVSEVAEHVAISNRGILERLGTGLAPLVEPVGVVDDEIPYLFYVGDEPPNVSTPTGTWDDVAEAAKLFDATAAAVADWADSTDLDLRAFGAGHPIFGVLDGMQWLLFAAAHTERHRMQLVGYQKRADFPTRQP